MTAGLLFDNSLATQAIITAAAAVFPPVAAVAAHSLLHPCVVAPSHLVGNQGYIPGYNTPGSMHRRVQEESIDV